ncbi:ribonuclease III [Dethiobacter alkaliphilus]|uniref:Ribonuclease 3 n=1 Tax=Dethiobacter alkaliphilus AHT 1 TaxID=555088 RepID=C0GHL1_DETAL|nr:ribonuclease III [Dethiobacter alkaliphilus]EEG77217.1 Ribonuclease III [Dethiobacter alkaliphilus AHT 1]
MGKKDLNYLFKQLNIEPKNREIYIQALTHSSYAHEHNLGSHAHNERLEFLGDAVLELVISEALFKRFPLLPEGKLTRFRAGMVCEDSLFKIANSLELGKYLRLGKGEAASGGRQRPSLLADAFEAMLGAMYLDQGFYVVQETVTGIFAPLFEDMAKGSMRHDYKTLMQEYTQASLATTPEYRIVAEQGPDHSKVFVAQLLLNREVYGEGSGRSKKEAEQEAARVAYQQLRAEK